MGCQKEAHPDDETLMTGTVYKLAHVRHCTVDLLCVRIFKSYRVFCPLRLGPQVTNGEGGGLNIVLHI